MVKNGTYPPDSYPNPGELPTSVAPLPSFYRPPLDYGRRSHAPFLALAYHNAQLEASAFREEFDPESFEDLTEPKYDMIHRVRTVSLSRAVRMGTHVIGKTVLPTHNCPAALEPLCAVCVDSGQGS